MTVTSRVRFLAPYDPREIFDLASWVVNAPTPYRHRHWPADMIVPNPHISAEPEQGADAWVYVEYGAEGSLLLPWPMEEQESTPDAYAVLTYVTDGSVTEAKHREWVRLAMTWGICHQVPSCWSYEYGDWCMAMPGTEGLWVGGGVLTTPTDTVESG